ncbi:MAG: class I SAM-dependent methyltransferase [Opitutaceae bacterium]|nr:class I SAM-dependent methyltransferase [Opitutaceae bacterium]
MNITERLRYLRHHVTMVWPRYRLSTGDFRTGLGPSAWLLHGLVRSLRPDVVVEIGSARGWSACHIGLALRENVHGRLYAIDPHGDTAWNDSGGADASLPALRRHLRAMGLEGYVEIIRADSQAAARGWNRRIDLIFIDGDHSYAGVKADWDLFSPFLTATGVAVFHDTTWELHRDDPRYRADMGVPRFVDDLRRQGFPVITLDRDCGLSLVQAPAGGRPLLP